MRTHTYRIFTILLILVNSIGAMAGGIILMLDPSGKLMEMPLEALQYTSFINFFIPGLILFIVNGLFGFVVLIMIYVKHEKYPLFIIIQAVLLGGWIIIQVMLLRGVHFLHFFYFAIAVVLLVLGILLKTINRELLEKNNVTYG